jgi:hypothetical protein
MFAKVSIWNRSVAKPVANRVFNGERDLHNCKDKGKDASVSIVEHFCCCCACAAQPSLLNLCRKGHFNEVGMYVTVAQVINNLYCRL